MLSVVEYNNGNFTQKPVVSVATFYKSLSQSYGMVDRRGERLEELEINLAELKRVIKLEGSCIKHQMPLQQCSWCYDDITHTRELKAHIAKLRKSLHGIEFRLLQSMQDCFEWANSEEKPAWLSQSMWIKTLEAAGKCGGKIYNTLRERLAEWKQARDSERPAMKFTVDDIRSNHPSSKFNPFIERLVYEGFTVVNRETEIVEKDFGRVLHSRQGQLLSETQLKYDEKVVTETESRIEADDADKLSVAAKTRKREDSNSYAQRIKSRYGITIKKPTVNHVNKSESQTGRLTVKSNFPVRRDS